MTLFEQLENLEDKAKKEDKTKIWEATRDFSGYVSLVSERNMLALFDDDTDELKLMDKRIEKEYIRCSKKLKFLNKLSIELSGKKIYTKSYMRDNVEKFFLEVLEAGLENQE